MSPSAVLRVVDALNQTGAPYLLTGSLARNVYLTPRSTLDGDFVVEMHDDQRQRLFASLAPDFEQEPQMAFETVTGKTRHRLRHRGSKFLIEIFEADMSDAHERSRFARRRPVEIEDLRVFVPTAEDIVVQKLRWFTRLRRAKDRDDVRELLGELRTTLDWEYINVWTREHGTAAALAECDAHGGRP